MSLLRKLFVKLIAVDHCARHLSEDAGDEGGDAILVQRRDFEALQEALDAVDPDEGHDAQTSARLLAVFDAPAQKIDAVLTAAGCPQDDDMALRVARVITERESLRCQAAGLDKALAAAVGELSAARAEIERLTKELAAAREPDNGMGALG